MKNKECEIRKLFTKLHYYYHRPLRRTLQGSVRL
jgi:hypothetical protein